MSILRDWSLQKYYKILVNTFERQNRPKNGLIDTRRNRKERISVEMKL